MSKNMNNLIIIAHPDKQSFCYNGIFKTIYNTLNENKENIDVIDLYEEKFNVFGDQEKTKLYQDLIVKSNRIYIISPVWWFRCTPLLESFFDQVLSPGFAYKFVNITKTYAYPVPFLKEKKVRTYLTHGAPALPVLTLYVNSVKLRLVMGVYSFVFGWFRTKTRQFWSVPFVSEEKRKSNLLVVKRDVERDILKK
jgi:putative NADPH-quinone reductase